MLKFFTSDLRRNLIKLLCLTIGLSIGMLLVARVYFDKTYDTFFDDADRTYVLCFTIERDGEFEKDYTVSGGYAPAVQRDIPQVEKATRFRDISGNINIVLEDGRGLTVENVCLADSNFFEIFNVPVTGGNPNEVLATRNQCVIPRSYAEKIGGDVIGATFKAPYYSETETFTIGAVYDDFPLNSTIPDAFYISMESFPDYTAGRDWLFGNDIYHSYFRLAPGATLDDVLPSLKGIAEKNVDEVFLREYHMNVIADELTSYYSSLDTIRIMDWMFMLLATILLVSAGLNFLLIVVGQAGKRSKEMAVRKCYGTSDLRIFGRVMGESVFFLASSVILAVLLVFSFPDLCQRLLGFTPAQLFTTGNVWIAIICVCLILLFLTGIIPAWIYCRTPVATAFRDNFRSRRVWKLALLSIQFFASGVLICLLVLIGRQYNMIANLDQGYKYDNVAFLYLKGTKQKARSEFVSTLRNLSCVEDVTTSDDLIGYFCSGNNVWIDGNPDKVVNVADNYDVNANFFDFMGMEFLQGETFTAESDSTINQVVVEEAFIDVLKTLTGEDKDYIVGSSFAITEHGNIYTICGVVNDIRRGDLYNVDKRAGVWFPTKKTLRTMYIRLTEASPENLAAVQEAVDSFFPDSELEVTTLKSLKDDSFAPIRDFRTSVLIAGVAILLIAFIGLIGYTGDEVNRRAKETAIRKVAGTPAGRIVSLFVRNILTVAVPALVAGVAVAMLAGREWLSQFAEQVSLSPFVMILCAIVLLLVITAVVVINTVGVASSNPVDHLRDE